MSAAHRRSKRSAKNPLVGEFVARPEEVLCEPMDEQIGERVSGRPSNRVGGKRPNLRKAGTDWSGDRPPSDNAAGDGGTHDVNEQMLAEQYRRGLRVCWQRSFQSQSLDFLFGGEGDDVVGE